MVLRPGLTEEKHYKVAMGGTLSHFGMYIKILREGCIAWNCKALGGAEDHGFDPWSSQTNDLSNS